MTRSLQFLALNVFVEHSPYKCPVNVFKKLEFVPYLCAECGLDPSCWNGRPLVLHLDHANGVKDDHRLNNLRWLCPNCHSQTETYGGRNIGRRARVYREG